MNIKKTLKNRTSMNNIYPNVLFSNLLDLGNNLGNGLKLDSNGKLDTSNINYMGSWVDDNEYHPNDLVKNIIYTETTTQKTYHISLYKCIVAHTSSATFEEDNDKWVEVYTEDKLAKYKHQLSVLAGETADANVFGFTLTVTNNIKQPPTTEDTNGKKLVYYLINSDGIKLGANYIFYQANGYNRPSPVNSGGVITYIAYLVNDQKIQVQYLKYLEYNATTETYDITNVSRIGTQFSPLNIPTLTLEDLSSEVTEL